MWSGSMEIGSGASRRIWSSTCMFAQQSKMAVSAANEANGVDPDSMMPLPIAKPTPLTGGVFEGHNPSANGHLC
jgi:hypothetical protein